MFDRQYASAIDLYGAFLDMLKPINRHIHQGPGVRNHHKPLGKLYRVPSGGKRECERRLRRRVAGNEMELS